MLEFENGNKLQEVLANIDTLQKRSELLENILQYYDVNTKTINIPPTPTTRTNTRISQGKWTQIVHPRERIFNKIETVLSQNELYDLRYL